MKRTLIPGLMLLAAFTLTNCSEQLVPPVQEDDVIVEETPSTEATEEEILGIPFEVYANASDEELETKTTNVNGDDKTSWELEDAIYVYHAPAGSTRDFTKHYKFQMRDLEENLFGGALAANTTLLADKSYDWYFIYPNNEDGSGSASTGNSKVSTKVVIGAEKGTDDKYVQNVSDVNEKTAGIYYPMYGKATTLGKQNPKVKMKHLSSLIALKVVNQGDSPKEDLTANRDGNEKNILIKELTFSVPSVTAIGSDGKSGKQTSLPIVGAFTVDITGNPEYTEIKNESSHTVTLKLPREIEIEPGNDATFYLAVRPFDASSIERNTNLPDPIFEVTINGSKRQVTIPAGKANFEAGKVTTLRVPVKLSYPKESDALSITSQGRLSDDIAENIITLCEPIYNNINGENTPIYVVGSEGSKGTITIKGFAKDMINALPVGFFASCWNDKLTAMTIKAINVDIPEYEEHSFYIPFVGTIGYTDYYIIKGRKPMSEKYGALVGILGWNFDNGISRDLIVNTLGIGASTITFNGIVPNGDFNSKNVVMLDENPVYKEVSDQKVEEYLKKFGSNATLQGLRDILNADFSDENDLDDNGVRYIPWTNAAKLTGEAIFSKIKGVIAGKAGNYAAGQALDIVGFKNYEALMYKLRDMKFELIIETYPYAPKYTTETPETTLQPIVFWGFDANVNN